MVFIKKRPRNKSKISNVRNILNFNDECSTYGNFNVPYMSFGLIYG